MRKNFDIVIVGRAVESGYMMAESKNPKILEISVNGKLDQFIGLVRLEQMKACGANPDYDEIASNVVPMSIYGPISQDPVLQRVSVYWLVVQGFHMFLDRHEKGESGMATGGPLGHLELRPGITLGELDQEARQQGTTLSRILRVGEMWASELPGQRIRVVFNVSRYNNPTVFWKWVDSFIAEMERHGFARRVAQTPAWLKKQASEQVQVRLPEVIRTIDDWIPRQRFKSEGEYEAALAEYLPGQGIVASEQQGASLTDILAAHGIGVEVKLTPDRSDYDRLAGQIMRQLEEFGIVVVLIMRPDKRDLLDEYERRFDDRVRFITKG